MMFNFQVNQTSVLRAGDRATAGRWSRRWPGTKPRPATAQWGMFLRNHDELDLGRLTDEQRQRCSPRSARTGHAALRPRHPPPAGADAARRPAPAGTGLQPDADAARHAGDALRRRDRHGRRSDACRSATARARRCSGRPSRTAASRSATSRCCRSISGGPYGFEHVNVAAQRRDPESLLNWTERMMPHAQGGAGDRLGRLHRVIDSGDPAVLVMRYDWRNNSALFVHNLGADPREVTIQRSRAWGRWQAISQPSSGEPQPRRCEGQAPRTAGAVWLSMVPRRWPRLHSQAKRGVTTAPVRKQRAQCVPYGTIGK